MISSLEKNIFLGNPKILSISTFFIVSNYKNRFFIVSEIWVFQILCWVVQIPSILLIRIEKIGFFFTVLRFGFFKFYAGLFFLLFLRFGFFNFYMSSVKFFLFYCFEWGRFFFFTVSEIWVIEIQGSIDKG
jgi:hypothetical protein